MRHFQDFTRWSAVVVLLGAGCGQKAVPAVSWPPLPKEGFVAGRPATTDDVNAGNAAFSLRSGGQDIGQPLKIEIPQYAYHLDEKGHRTPGIVIQAEEGMGIKMVGMRQLSDGKTLGALYQEFEFLGTQPPSPRSK